MARYRTRRYVALTWADALRLARIDGTPVGSIVCWPEVELLHRTEWWAWWSDQRLTTAIGLPDGIWPQGLMPDAVQLISEIWEGLVLRPRCGWALLAEVKRILDCEMLGRREQPWVRYPVEIWERLRVELVNGQQQVLYRYWWLYEEEYGCDIRTERPSLRGF